VVAAPAGTIVTVEGGPGYSIGSALFALMIAQNNAPTIYRELDAAARAEVDGAAVSATCPAP
jgi:hypothetical protein